MTETKIKCVTHDISFRHEPNDIITVKSKVVRRQNVYARVSDTPVQQHFADAIYDTDTIDRILAFLIEKQYYFKAAMFVFNINTGFRNGDTLSLRVKDVFRDGKIKDFLTLKEDKTNKVRMVWLNNAVKIALKFIINLKHLKSEDYLFQTDGCKRAYIKEIVIVDGELLDVKTTGERYEKDEHGNIIRERQLAPIQVQTVNKMLSKVKKDLGLTLKISSHSFRQTYAWFISQGWNDNRNALAVCSDFGHSSERTTLEHYMRVPAEFLKEKQLSLNLGLEELLKHQIILRCSMI